MIPKQKAAELAMKFYSPERNIWKSDAKKLSLIVVDEIIENNYNLMQSIVYHKQLNYWEEVRTEIEGL